MTREQELAFNILCSQNGWHKARIQESKAEIRNLIHDQAAKIEALRKECAEKDDKIEQQAAELAILSQKNPNGDRNPSPGDPCGRSCEGQAYRIELRQALAKVEQHAKEIGTNTIVINEQAKELASLRAELQRRNNLDALNMCIDSYFSEN